VGRRCFIPELTMFAKAWPLLKQTATEFWSDNAMRLGAALAFYTALSLSPLLLIVISIAGMVFDKEAASGEVVNQLKGLIGEEGASTVQTMLVNSRQKDTGVWATVFGLVTLVAGATGVFAQLQDALNAIWDAPPEKSSSGIWGAVKDRLLSFSLVCGMAFLLLVSLMFSAVVHALNGALRQLIPTSPLLVDVLNLLLSTVLTFLMFAMIYKVLPRKRPQWSDVWVGAGMTAILFAIGKYLIGLYIGQTAVSSTYGAAGSFVVLMLWLYYSSLILLFGAEFTQVYAKLYGSGVGKTTGVPTREGHGVISVGGGPSQVGLAH
jgi:membrane protein